MAANKVEQRVIKLVQLLLGLEDGDFAWDLFTWGTHGAIAFYLTQGFVHVFEHFELTTEEQVAVMVALFFAYREVEQHEGEIGLDDVMDVIGPAVVAVVKLLREKRSVERSDS